MTHNTTARPNAAQMLHEAQGYRTSLEALMSVGRALLLNPSMESDSADSFKVLAEDVLEQADHQADLQVVDGVSEPQAQVELIMMDVLTPRLTEVEQIEQALQAKADSDEPVPFTTRDSETAASMEALSFRAEALGLFKDNIDTVRAMISMEGVPVDAVRPLVLNVARRLGDGLEALGVSLEDLGQTQVLGEMSDAVDRIEQLVATAKESAEESVEAARQEAAAIGGDGEDRMGDLIERHRGENPSGPKLDDGVTANSIATDTPSSQAAEENLDGAVDPAAEPVEGESTDLGEQEAPIVDDATPADAVDPEADIAAAEAEAAAEETAEAGAEAENADADVEAANAEAEAAAAAATEEEEEDDEEKDGKPSTESHSDPIVIEDISTRVQDVDAVVGISRQLMSWLDANGLLTADGKACLAAGVDHTFCLNSNMVVEAAGSVLIRHYDTWVAGCIRDGETNTRALAVLMNI